jgi:hypothetical protein
LIEACTVAQNSAVPGSRSLREGGYDVEWTVAIGVDTHRDLHVAVALDPLGRALGSLEFEVNRRGFAELESFACSFGKPAFAIEGTGS